MCLMFIQTVFPFKRAPLIAQLVKNPPATQETWVRSLGWEEPLVEGKGYPPTPVFWPREFHGLYQLKTYRGFKNYVIK